MVFTFKFETTTSAPIFDYSEFLNHDSPLIVFYNSV